MSSGSYANSQILDAQPPGGAFILAFQNGKVYHSWIVLQLQIGTSSQLLLRGSDFKESETSFGFLSPNYTGHDTWFLL